MRDLIIASVLLMAPVLAFSQATPGDSSAHVIRGIVTDSNQSRPIKFAAIRAYRGSAHNCRPPADFGTAADSSGRFALRVPAPGQYVVCAGAIGYAWRSASVSIPKDSSTTVQFRLPEQAFQIDY